MLDFLSLINSLETEEQRITAANLFEKYQNAMYWIAFNVLKNDMDAEDAVMKAAENICVHIDDFSKLNEDDTKLLISSIVKNTAIDIYRRNKNFSLQSTDEYIFSEDDTTTTVEDELPDLFAEFDFGLLQKYVVKLKEKYKIVLIMRYKENLSNQAISRRLNLPVSTIGTHLERAKKELRKIIEEAQNDKPE